MMLIVLKITQKGARKTGKALKGVTTSAAGLASKVGLVSAGFGALSVKLAGDFQKSLLEVSTFCLPNSSLIFNGLRSDKAIFPSSNSDSVGRVLTAILFC